MFSIVHCQRDQLPGSVADNALGLARRAGGIEDIGRVVPLNRQAVRPDRCRIGNRAS